MNRGLSYTLDRPDSAPAASAHASPTPLPKATRWKQPVTPSTDVPSFAAFQAYTSKVNLHSPVKRKPLPSSASPNIPRLPLSSGGRVVAIGEEGSSESPALSSGDPTAIQTPLQLPNSSEDSQSFVIRDLDRFPRGHSPLVSPTPQAESFPYARNNGRPQASQEPDHGAPPPTRILNHVRLASEPMPHELTRAERVFRPDGPQRAVTMTLYPGGRPTALHINADSRSFSKHEPQDPATITRTPRSPGPNKLTSFFGWRTSSPIAEVSPSSTSGRSRTSSHSPGPSPLAPSPFSASSSTKSVSRGIDAPKANGSIEAAYFPDMGFPFPPKSADLTAQILAMDDELREVSSELAGSIRRELELEDLVDRLQLEMQQGQEFSQRTSDYFSDSGASSLRYTLSENGNKAEDIAKAKRISEQEKAQFKLGLTQKLQDERERRKVLEMHIQQLGHQVQHIDEERARSSSVASRVRELENTVEDFRRRLLEERRGKENLEDLLNALRDEIQQYRDERDNLRDEVVPQLRTQLKGLEGESSEYEKVVYENAQLQQEMKRLGSEISVMNTKRSQLEMQYGSRFESIAEEGELSPTSPTAAMSLARSNFVTQGTVKGGLSRTGSLNGLGSLSAKEREAGETLADLKDVEMQRNALHSTLKSLLNRQNYQANEHKKKIRALEVERDRALQSQSPRRMGYEKEVTNLRNEINQLRKRADDALMQKWQCEKGLGGLKMDLDRAEQETSSLRSLLQEHDILIPETAENPSQEVQNEIHATSASLEKAYADLRATQALSVSRLRDLWGTARPSDEDTEAAKTMDLLLKSICDAKAERDFAQKQGELYRAKADSLEEAKSFHTGEIAGLADQFRSSADRIEALAAQVRLQLESNGELRQRLAEAVGRGEHEQKTSAIRINSLQSKLRSLEDKLMTAQQNSEDALARHEDEVREIHDCHNAQLQRLKTDFRTPTVFSPKSPISPIFTPKLNRTPSAPSISMTDALRIELLEKKVKELERALAEADREMREVVGRMNHAQIEVLELQSARDEAMRQTKKLHAEINAEREKVKSLIR